MPTSEQECIDRSLQTEGSLDKLIELGLFPEDLDGLTVLDLGAVLT